MHHNEQVLAKAVRLALRSYQYDIKADIKRLWAEGVRNVLAVLPTGAGKTVTFSDIIHDEGGAVCAIAHRQELVIQISKALAEDGVRHKIIGPDSVVKACVAVHVEEFGKSYYDPNSMVAVAGIKTILSRKDDKQFKLWAATVKLWVMDEAHHTLQDNEWGRGVACFPNARGLGVTATASRTDGCGLGRHADGVFDRMVVGPGMRDLINLGYLTDYRIIAPKTQGLDRDNITIGSTGEYTKKSVKKALEKSQIIGDVVAHYQRFAGGKLGVTFAACVESATEIAKKFNDAGVPAAVVHAKTPDNERRKLLRKFKNRELLQLVNVDLFGEGFDLPAIEVVSMARPTMSYGLFVQQFGRALRLMITPQQRREWESYTPPQRLAAITNSAKPRAIIIDHVGNIHEHGLPDRKVTWTLDARERRRRGQIDEDAIPTRTCDNPVCLSVYERIYKACPFCGEVYEPTIRSAPEYVDGDLSELSPEVLARMRGEVEKIDMTVDEFAQTQIAARVPTVWRVSNCKKHKEKQDAQAALRSTMELWGGYQYAKGYDRNQSQRLFYWRFGIDVLSAQALPRADAVILTDKIMSKIIEGKT